MKKLIIALIVIGCTKSPLKPTCQRVYLLSYKYNLDTVYLRTDSLWPWGKDHNDFCNSDTLQFMDSLPYLRVCSESMFETRRYVIGNKLTTPIQYK